MVSIRSLIGRLTDGRYSDYWGEVMSGKKDEGGKVGRDGSVWCGRTQWRVLMSILYFCFIIVESDESINFISFFFSNVKIGWDTDEGK